MKILKNYRRWKRFNNLMEHWDERVYRLKDIEGKYRPRKRTDFLKYGKVIGELDCIRDSIRVLNGE